MLDVFCIFHPSWPTQIHISIAEQFCTSLIMLNTPSCYFFVQEHDFWGQKRLFNLTRSPQISFFLQADCLPRVSCRLSAAVGCVTSAFPTIHQSSGSYEVRLELHPGLASHHGETHNVLLCLPSQAVGWHPTTHQHCADCSSQSPILCSWLPRASGRGLMLSVCFPPLPPVTPCLLTA